MSRSPEGNSGDRGGASAPLKFVTRTVSLAVKFDTVLYPFDGGQFARLITDQGFILPEALSLPNVQVSGLEARKGNVAARIDGQRMTLGVSSPDARGTLAEMEAMEALVNREFGVNCSDLAHFYELVTNCLVVAHRNPLESWPKRFAGSRLMAQFSEVLGFEVVPFGLRVAPSGEDPNRTNWFEARIEPQVPHANRQHYINIVFRNARREMVYSFASGLDEMIKKLIALVEQE